MEHTLNAPVDKVWALWNDPEAMKKWWSPKDFTAPVVKNDFRVGDTFLLSMKSPKNEMFWNTGTYRNIIPGSEVKAPGQWPDEVTVRVTFNEEGGKTHVSVQETGIPLII